MYKNLILIVCTLLFFSCSGQERELSIPNTVHSTITPNHKVYPASRVWWVAPEGYSLRKESLKYEKDFYTFIKITDGYSRGYEYTKRDYLLRRDDCINKGYCLPTYYRKEFMLNSDKAFLEYFNPYEKSGKEQIILIVGNEKLATRIDCELKPDDRVFRDEMLKALLSIYIDHEMQRSPGVLIDYEVDFSKTDFYLSNTVAGFSFQYRAIGAPEDFVVVSPINHLGDSSAIRKFAESTLQLEKKANAGLTVSNAKGKFIYLNDEVAYELSGVGQQEDKQMTIYILVTGNGKDGILMSAKIPLDKSEWLNQITAASHTAKRVRNK